MDNLPGNKPFTQQTRDSIAQNDHDAITRLTVLVETVLAKVTGLEQQIKDVTVSQSAGLAGLEAKTTTNHNSLDVRVRKLEDQSNKYIPEYVNRVDDMQKAIEVIQTGKSEMLGGWKATVMIFGAMAGFASVIWIIAQLIFRLKLM